MPPRLRLWYDIYRASSWYGNTEAYGDPFSDPAYKVRSVYQANIWGDMHWYDAQQQGHNSGKRLLMYDEFIAMASDTVESNTFGTLVGRTGGNSLNGRRLVSFIGAEDCAGVRKQWGREIGAGAATELYAGVYTPAVPEPAASGIILLAWLARRISRRSRPSTSR
jgi:hypothetical protein